MPKSSKSLRRQFSTFACIRHEPAMTKCFSPDLRSVQMGSCSLLSISVFHDVFCKYIRQLAVVLVVRRPCQEPLGGCLCVCLWEPRNSGWLQHFRTGATVHVYKRTGIGPITHELNGAGVRLPTEPRCIRGVSNTQNRIVPAG